MLGMLRKLFGRFTPSIFSRVLNIYIRPTLEYMLPAWAPWLQKDITLLDKIYPQATKLVEGLNHTAYSERMAILRLSDTSGKIIRVDLILVYKILHNWNHPLSHFLQLRPQSNTRSHAVSVTISHSRLDFRKQFFLSLLVSSEFSITELP